MRSTLWAKISRRKKTAKDAQVQAAKEPLRVEITNASEFADKRGTVGRVERGNDGLVTGAVAQKI